MPIVHFLNVKDGDCSIIQHGSGRVTVIDVCNASPDTFWERLLASSQVSDSALEKGLNGNFNQKNYPVNPILYMKDRGINSVWRFIQTHPDMDHMDGLKAFFEAFKPDNFWDTENLKECPFENGNSCNGYSKDDWDFYQNLRNSNPSSDPKRLVLYANDTGKYWNINENGQSGADGLYILAPTPALIKATIAADDYNDSSYVLLYKAGNNRVLFAGDSHDATWEYILENFTADVANVDILIAPHHGRHSDRDWEFLDVVNPALTLFGNAPSEHLAYDAWNNRGLPFITNNQAGCIVLNVEVSPAQVYVTCESFAKKLASNATYNSTYRAYYVGTVKTRKAAAAAG
jgi:competence protein ComEC